MGATLYQHRAAGGALMLTLLLAQVVDAAGLGIALDGFLATFMAFVIGLGTIIFLLGLGSYVYQWMNLCPLVR
jgi:hypothetical protein